MRVLIIGANGQTGYQICQQIAEHPDHTAVAMVRDAHQFSRFDRLGCEVVAGDLESPFDSAMAGCDAVIFAAGSGGHTGKDKTVLVDHLGAIRSMVTALKAGARRYVMLSGLHVNRDVTGGRIPHWRRAKGRADHFLRTMPDVFDGEGLDYTIVCPGKLTDREDANGIQLIAADGEGETSRKMLAATLVASLDQPATIGRTFGVIDGEIPVPTALGSLPTS